jgi:hypothetical protein
MENERAVARYPTNRAAKISFDDGSVVSCNIRDLSTQGARIELSAPAKIPDHFVLAIENQGVRHRCHVAWRANNFMGVYFD